MMIMMMMMMPTRACPSIAQHAMHAQCTSLHSHFYPFGNAATMSQLATSLQSEDCERFAHERSSIG
eukprot:2371216-Amphidinium_carterae.1